VTAGDVVGFQGRDWVLTAVTTEPPMVALRTDDDPDGESIWAPADAVELRWHPTGGWVNDNPWIWGA
jgi:hypothetical protein